MSDVHHSCDSYLPGHRVHPTQWRYGRATTGKPVTLLSLDGLTAVVRVGDGLEECWRFHDAANIRRALESWRESMGWLHEYGLLRFGPAGRQKCLYPCRTPESWTECRIATAADPDNPAGMIEKFGGFLIAGSDAIARFRLRRRVIPPGVKRKGAPQPVP